MEMFLHGILWPTQTMNFHHISVFQIKQLHYGLQQSKCVLLTGPCGSGKTTCFRILAAAYQQVKELQALSDQSRRISMDTRSDVIKYPTVTMTYLNPAAFSMEEVHSYCTVLYLHQVLSMLSSCK